MLARKPQRSNPAFCTLVGLTLAGFTFASLTLAGLTLAGLTLTGIAQADQLTANDIAHRMVRGDALSCDGAKAHVRMVLSDKQGAHQERTMDVIGRRDKGLLRTLMRFSAPANIAGTAFLMLERNGKAAEQYVYLSGLKRTRRIVGREQENSFMESDFSYADMRGIPERFSQHKRLPDDDIGGIETYVLQTDIHPQSKMPYQKIVHWVRKTDMVALRTRFYDRSGQLLKTLYARKIKDLEGKPIVVEARMENQQSGHVTELFVENISRKDNIPLVLFTPSSLAHY